jgi:cell division protein FtsZ
MTDDVITQLAAARTNPSIIMVVGVGGAGGNAVNHMWNLGIKGVDFMVCNTDQQALDKSPVELKVRLLHLENLTTPYRRPARRTSR